MTSQVLIK